ncbi:MAG TPA: hypothetical protein VGQ35_07435 [Dongiaceae bacterium]|nr:hypothetical protein [Dongiaceae bacterium]
MRARLFGLAFVALVFPAIASADGTQQPKFPPGFDCSAVAAGSQRQACNSSHLDPPMGAVPETKRVQPQTIVPPPQPPKLPTAKPPTIPRLPGTIDPGN